MDSSYPQAIAFVLKQEGGYTNDPKDPGGPTNWGITIWDARRFWKVDASASDVRAMPLQVAKDIYQSKYWQVVAGPSLPAGLDLCTFDSAVNSGTGRADKWLASAIPCTIRSYEALAKAANINGPEAQSKSIDRYCDVRLSFLHSLRTWDHFGKGWGSRVAQLRAKAHVLFLQASGKTPAEVKAVIVTKTAEAKKKQSTDLSTGALTTGGQTAAHWTFWHWDFTHVAILLVGILLTVYLARKVVQNTHLITAFEEELKSL